MGPSDIKQRFDQIVEFAGIDSYLDTPVKRYSSGMLARLGFAIASHLEVEIVVLDEVLAVGDADFQRKCHDRIAFLRGQGAALLYVTHALWTLPKLCDEAVLLINGKVEDRGKPADVIRAYERYNPDSEAAQAGPTVFRSVTSSASVIDPGGSVRIHIEIDVKEPYPFGQILVGVSGANDANIGVVGSTSKDVSFDRPGAVSVECELCSLSLYPGPYKILVGFCADTRLPVVDDMRTLGIDIRGEELNQGFGFTSFPARWHQLSEIPDTRAEGASRQLEP